MNEEAPENRYTVHTAQGEDGWVVRITKAGGAVAWARPCADETEARTFASTVQQHIYWLSEAKFRQYYRLPEPGEAASG